MNRIMALLLTVTSISHAAEVMPHELVIQHVPQNSEIIKTCANATQTQATHISKDNRQESAGYHFSSITIHSAAVMTAATKPDKTLNKTDDCTLTIRTVNPCAAASCRQTIDFRPKPS